MNTSKLCRHSQCRLDKTAHQPNRFRLSVPTLVLSLLVAMSGMAVAQDVDQFPVAQQPLTVGENVPGHLVLTPSVEWPTVLSVANLGNYDQSADYAGYFDSGKCYEYIPDSQAGALSYDADAVRADSKGYFSPVGLPSDNKGCDGDWSGHLLNWAATQTIDTFRSALTGGYRVVDQPGMTVLEKARHTGQNTSGYWGINSGNVSIDEVIPFETVYFEKRLAGLNNQMWFAISGVGKNKNADPPFSEDEIEDLLRDTNHGDVDEYVPGEVVEPGKVYFVNIDVEVCVDGMLEDNCVAYGNNHKPEGLIQEYGEAFTYSVFGYFNTDDNRKDGAPLRVARKFVGPTVFDPVDGETSNDRAEWDPDTGVFYKNPDGDGSWDNTGLINYINKFGQLKDYNLKSFDPVSEMYYAAIRYLKGQDAVDSYGNEDYLGNLDRADDRAYDGFPVVSEWEDPRKYWCENDFILGIGDANTHDDKNLPGATATNDEPSTPTEVSADELSNGGTVDVVTATDKVFDLEGINKDADASSFTGRDNSAFIAGLAYDSHTKDMRPFAEPDNPTEDELTRVKGVQTVSTYWVDVVENQILEPKANNQYWLAAKYGGFTVPDGFDPYARADALPESWWHTNGDTLSTGDRRPDNFFTGGNAVAMKEALEKAFSAIASENTASRTSPSVSSTALETDSAVYQATYKEGEWSGTLRAYSIDATTGEVSSTANWSASDNRLAPDANDGFFTSSNGSLVSFTDNNAGDLTSDQVAYLRGDASEEERNGGSLRNRTNTLGDIVNSSPVFVGAPIAPTAPSVPNKDEFASDMSGYADRSPVVYVAANDGFLHALDAETGAELFAYVPSTLLSGGASLASYTEPDYGSLNNPHQYFHDGQVSVATVYADGAWRTVLAGTTGRGLAKTIYALDVTDPQNPSLLWETTASELGQVVGRPIFAQTAEGEWSVLVGNGYNSTSGEAALLQFDVASGNLTTHGVSGSGTYGLATPGVPITDAATGVSSWAIAGDGAGNLWRFDLSSGSSTGELVFAAGSDKPITAEVLLGQNPIDGNWWAFFGTGKYLSVADLNDTNIQSWFGIQLEGDAVSYPIDSSDLMSRDIVYEDDRNRLVSFGTSGDMIGKPGWSIDLVPTDATIGDGERMVTRNQFKNGLLVATTLIPEVSDPCAPTGAGWVMAVDPFTGTNPAGSFFDLNRDGVVNDDDLINYDPNNDDVDGDGEDYPGAGIRFDSLAGIPAFVGNRMIVNVGGELQDFAVGGSSGDGRRTSWREILGN